MFSRISYYFYHQTPMLLLSCAALCGYSYAMKELYIAAAPTAILLFFFFYSSKKTHSLKILALLLSVVCFFSTQSTTNHEAWLSNLFEGRISIYDKREYANFKKTFYIYKATIDKVYTKSGYHTFNTPPKLTLLTRNKIEETSTTYFLKGSLTYENNGRYSCNTITEITPIEEKRPDFVKRFNAKIEVQKFLKKYSSDPNHLYLFINLLTGEGLSGYVSFLFYRLGLSHLLAISGLHFGMAIALLFYILSRFMSQRLLAITLALSAICGYWFLGSSPSILRAFIATLVYVVGLFFYRQPNGLNTLGLCFLGSFFIEPFSLKQPGFLLSYLATFGILTLYTPINQKITPIIPYTFLRTPLCLTLSVFLFTFPLTLCLFNEYPFISLLSNLLFPWIIGIIYTMLLIASLFFFLKLHFLTSMVFWFINHITTLVFLLLHHPPYPLLGTYVVSLSPLAVQISLIVMVVASLIWALHHQYRQREQFLTKHF